MVSAKTILGLFASLLVSSAFSAPIPAVPEMGHGKRVLGWYCGPSAKTGHCGSNAAVPDITETE
ncbi:hypothetical protein IFR05_009320 [Cadophora sp. M221]|nr:hypothetical protein IFR05_009320 [Cadophora sp. M221]